VEAAQQVIAYLQGSLLVSLTIAFVAGFAADKVVAYERRSGVIFFLVVGVLGLFLGEFMLFSFKLDEYIEPIADFRLFFDLIAAFVGSFLVAAIIHFIKPT
jgi:uncharacterized membrane protein YeaQ/YmgE (transglycosylase-associated protein family)